MARLVVTDGSGSGTTFELERSAILGRQKGVQILVDDIGTSREHAKVYRQEDSWFVIDLNSRNGTLVNGVKAMRHTLAHGDVIGIGNTRIRFEAPELAAAAPPAPPPPERTAAPPPRPLSTGPAAAPAAVRGPSALERERERLREEAERKARGAAGTRAPSAGDDDIVVRDDVLQYGRIENVSGIHREDLAQRGPLVKLAIGVLCLAFFSGVVWTIVKVLEKDPEAAERAIDEGAPADEGG